MPAFGDEDSTIYRISRAEYEAIPSVPKVGDSRTLKAGKHRLRLFWEKGGCVQRGGESLMVFGMG